MTACSTTPTSRVAKPSFVAARPAIGRSRTCGSTNGVKVSDREVDASRLAPGDVVVLGTVRFTFDIEH